jgi:pyruvate/2-oxoglutarate dehydrogenase complex dihydrolipoamide dehydrogenase (E3) component
MSPAVMPCFTCGDAVATSSQLSPIATYEGRVVGRNIVDGPKAPDPADTLREPSEGQPQDADEWEMSASRALELC